MTTKIEQKIKDSPMLRVCFLKPETYYESLACLLKEYLTTDTSLIYVTINKPCDSVKSFLENTNIHRKTFM